jgi:hypothetical protein
VGQISRALLPAGRGSSRPGHGAQDWQQQQQQQQDWRLLLLLASQFSVVLLLVHSHQGRQGELLQMLLLQVLCRVRHGA